MITLMSLKCSSNRSKWLVMTQTIRFGNHDLEIRSDDSSFTGLNAAISTTKFEFSQNDKVKKSQGGQP